MFGPFSGVAHSLLSAVATGLIIDGIGTVMRGERYSGWGLNQIPGWSRGPVKSLLDASPLDRRFTALLEILAGVALIYVVARVNEDEVADDELEDDIQEGRVE